MKNLRLYHVIILIIGVLGVCIAPWLFTHPVPFGWESLDFTQTGSIGDTIGGITAPIVGLVSILLLWWTLRSQLEFNARQERINIEQKQFNDANRMLSMEVHILHMDENLSYAYTGLGRILEGHGVASLKMLAINSSEVKIVRSELACIIAKVHVIETAVCSMLDFLDKSSLSKEEKTASLGMAEMYLTDISDFYQDITAQRISWISTIEELHYDAIDLPDPVKVMKQQATEYADCVKKYLEGCRSQTKK